MDGRCATCRWWEPVGLEWTGGRVPPNYDRTEVDPALDGWGKCTRVFEDPTPGSAIIESLGYCEEDVGLLTAPDFGCVLWAAKPQE